MAEEQGEKKADEPKRVHTYPLIRVIFPKIALNRLIMASY
jgi:hypothetical protein